MQEILLRGLGQTCDQGALLCCSCSLLGILSLCVSQEWKISRLTFEYDSEPFGKERDAAIKKLAMEAGVEVIVKISHTLYDLDK